MTVMMSQPEQAAPDLRLEVRRIIAAGQRPCTVRAGSTRSAMGLTGVSLILLWLSFTPVEFAPAAWVALVPLCQLLRLRSLPRFCLTATWLTAFVWALTTLQWMRLGHPAMYLALVALAAYVAMYIPAFLWIGRRCVRLGLPLWLAVPVVWTALEHARAWLLTGFSWYYLGHSQYRWLSLIQISDITGAYGVSFIVAIVSAAIASQVPLRWLRRWNLDAEAEETRRWRLRLTPIVVAMTLFAGCVGYGVMRQTPVGEFPSGPVFALIQGNFTPELKHNQDLILTRFRVHEFLTQRAVLLQPDFIVWPETMFPWPLQSAAEGVTDDDILSQMPAEIVREYGNEAAVLAQPFRTSDVQDRLANDAMASGAALVIGVEAAVARKRRLEVFNSVAFIRPDIGYVGRYDKIHRVIFGEYIPLKSLFPWLTKLTPFGSNFGIDEGSDVRMFEYAGFRVAPLICFEDTVPHLVRKMAAQKDAAGRGCDVLVNATNDAWFRGSSELDQHLITAAFRAVESRMPVVRCVNGGISAFIDGNGQIREPDQILVMKEPLEGLQSELSSVQGMRDPKTGSWRRQFSGIICGQVPTDPRDSLYVRFGDWFAGLCSLATLLVTGLSFFRNFPPRASAASSPTHPATA